MIENTIENNGDLIPVEHKSLPMIFSEGKANDLVDEIEKKAKAFVLDASTSNGRKDIASLAYKIARSKKLLDDAGKQLTTEWKAKSKKIDEERSRIWSRLESLQEEIRAPVTEYENKEKERKEKHQSELDEFKNIIGKSVLKDTPIYFNQAIFSCEELLHSRDWQEFTEQAKDLSEKCVLILKEKLAIKISEIERQKREEAEKILKAEQERRENDECLAKEEAEKALRIAEENERAKKAEEAHAAAIERDKAETESIIEKAHRALKEEAILRGRLDKDSKECFVSRHKGINDNTIKVYAICVDPPESYFKEEGNIITENIVYLHKHSAQKALESCNDEECGDDRKYKIVEIELIENF